MPGKIEALFHQYQRSNPLYRTEVIVDMMLDDGVIDFDTAKKILSGESLFLIDCEIAQSKPDASYTEIFGGYFKKTESNEVPQTDFNRRIETTRQPVIQGDCLLLSDINALNQKDWGREVISDALIPDENGGVTVKFKNSPLKEKEIYLTAEEIDEARKSGNYAEGDDDMIAFELAAEKTFREMVRSGLAERCINDNEIERRGGKYRSYLWGGVKTDEFKQYPVSELLGIKTYRLDFSVLNKHQQANSETEKIFNWILQNEDNISMTCGFNLTQKGYGNPESKDYIKRNHAYAIKDFDCGETVSLLDPHYPDYEIKLDWEVFEKFVRDINLSFKDDKTEKQFMKVVNK